jgi:hypothetical protein
MRIKAIVTGIVPAGYLALAVAAFAQSPTLKYGDGQPDGKKSLGGSGEIVAYALPAGGGKVSGIKIHGSRYGTPDSPNENFLIYVLSQDMSEIVRTEMAPYSLFERGPEKWVEVKFRKSFDVPKDFWVAVDFRAGRTKGVYVSYDTSTGGKHSRVGLPGLEAKPTDVAGDWMIEVVLEK